MTLTNAQIQQFKIDGYLVLPNLLSTDKCTQLRELIERHLQQRVEPYELEADVHYPGAPESESAVGGATIRRLLMAFQRDQLLQDLARFPATTTAIQQILDSEHLFLNLNHHNCVMTKQPTHSSKTLWHRDTRYWNFDHKYLINVWFALGNEYQENGSLMVLPGSHRWEVASQALDDAQFLKLEHSENLDRLATQRMVNLQAGDALLFSAHCFHAAGKNTTERPKFSAVFTYHGEDTQAIAGTHSAKMKEVKLDPFP
jgi:phytanoyl-CoA hydroxylase